MVITGVECDVLLDPGKNGNASDTAGDNAVVRVRSSEGTTGIGEVESNSWVIKALIESPGYGVINRSLGELLIGQDASQPQAIWDRLYQCSLLVGRRGAAVSAIGALDIAVWDLFGKSLGLPVWQLLGKAPSPVITPYASLLPCGNTLAAYSAGLLAKIEWARNAGFKAVKAEVLIHGPYAQPGIQAGLDAVVGLVEDCRATLGSGATLMVDVGYCCRDWQEALALTRRLERYDLYFLETPLPPDDLDGYARLSDATGVRIAAGELLQTRFEFEELMDRGKVDVVQPDVARVGGITEAMRVAQMAIDRGKLVIPHCWKSAISIAAAMHFAAVLPNCPFIEFLPSGVSESQIRRDLVLSDFVVQAGELPLPEQPGLGVTLNVPAFSRFVDAARRFTGEWQAAHAASRAGDFLLR